MANPSPQLELLLHPLEEPSLFTPEALLDAVRAERGVSPAPVPAVCLLDFDGDLTDWLVAAKQTRPWPSWACFHTRMESFAVDGQPVGLIARTIGGPYAVLIAEQLAASGARIILGLTSAGRVSPRLPIPSLVIPDRAIRDEGTSFHYLPAAGSVSADPALNDSLRQSLSALRLPVLSGTVWTTDAPYRETATQLDRHAGAGVLAVEMQAASLFAFAQARGARCGVVVHVTNGAGHDSAAQFDKGAHESGFEILQAMARAGLRLLAGQQGCD